MCLQSEWFVWGLPSSTATILQYTNVTGPYCLLLVCAIIVLVCTILGVQPPEERCATPGGEVSPWMNHSDWRHKRTTIFWLL